MFVVLTVYSRIYCEFSCIYDSIYIYTWQYNYVCIKEKILKFQYEPRFPGKSFPGILVLGPRKILKFQYFTEISVFPGNQEPRFPGKSFPGILVLGSWFP